MDKFEKLLLSSLDTGAIGLITEFEPYENVFVPTNAQIIAAGDHDIQFCRVPCLGQTIFCIDPHAPDGDQICPVAENTDHFLQLILTCGGIYPLSMAARWSRQRFNAHIEAQAYYEKSRQTLRAMKNICNLQPLADPYAQIRALQDSFDYSAIPLHPDYDEHSAHRPGSFQWEVYYAENFCTPGKGEKAGKVITQPVYFQRKDQFWVIPAVYDCGNGYVVDCCVRRNGDELRKYFRKWNNRENLTADEQFMKDAENPMEYHASISLQSDGKTIAPECIHQWYYCPEADNSVELRHTIRHYDLDEDTPWTLLRLHFPKKGKKKKSPARSLSLQIDARQQEIPGICISDPEVGGRYLFAPPYSDQMHTLTVTEYSREQLDPNFLIDPPGHYIQMTCSVLPPLNHGSFRIYDCAESDPFRSGSGVGEIIGHSRHSGIPLQEHKSKNGHVFLSSFHYAPAKSVTWRMVHLCKLYEPMTVRLLAVKELP